MSDVDLKEIFRQAAEISETVPESLREAAFNKAVDALLGKMNSREARPRSNAGRPRLREGRRTDRPSVDDILENLDRTAHPDVRNATRVLDRALHLLLAVKEQHGVDGLGASAIARILTDKFRVRTTRQAVQQALDGAGDKVDRVTPASGGSYYRIMHPGEVYLSGGSKESRAPDERHATSSRKRKPKKTESAIKEARRSTTVVGPRTAVEQLIAEGFFAEKRRIGDIAQHLDHKKGYKFKVTSLSPVLTRMLRDGRLDRTRADDGQYEYEKK